MAEYDDLAKRWGGKKLGQTEIEENYKIEAVKVWHFYKNIVSDYAFGENDINVTMPAGQRWPEFDAKVKEENNIKLLEMMAPNHPTVKMIRETYEAKEKVSAAAAANPSTGKTRKYFGKVRRGGSQAGKGEAIMLTESPEGKSATESRVDVDVVAAARDLQNLSVHGDQTDALARGTEVEILGHGPGTVVSSTPTNGKWRVQRASDRQFMTMPRNKLVSPPRAAAAKALKQLSREPAAAAFADL